MASHLTIFFPGRSSYLYFGVLGVDLFFLLSGYLVSIHVFQAYKETGQFDLKSFFVKRFTKILPLYYFVFFAYLILSFGEFEIFNIENKLATFLLLSNFPSLVGHGIGVSWSLCVEEHFYILFALSMYSLRHNFEKIKIHHFGIIFLLFVLIRFYIAVKIGLLNQSLLNMNSSELNNYVWKHLTTPSYTRMDGILLGVLVGYIQIFREKWFQRLMSKAMHTIFIAPFVYYTLLYIQKTMWLHGLAPIARGIDILSLTFGPILGHLTFFLVFIFGLKIPNNHLGFFGKGFSFIAKISYPLYLIHHAIFEYVHTLNFNLYLTIALALLVSFLLSYVLYYVFERKMMFWLREKFL